MKALPQALGDYGVRAILSKREPAWFCVGRDGRVTESGGNLGLYGLDELRAEKDPFEVAPFLVGLLPADEHGFCIPLLHVADQCYADVHIVGEHSRDWVMLMLANGEAQRRIADQQARNELALELEKSPQTATVADSALELLAPDDGAVAQPVAWLGRSSAGNLGAVLAAVNMAAFESCGATGFRPVGPLPSVLARRFPALAAERVDLEREFAFLGHFLEEARCCWAGEDGPIRRSGFWTEVDESGAACRLEATAVRRAGRGLLLLELVDKRHDDIQEILQGAHENTLALEKLRAAQIALQESERRFRTLADGAPVMIWMSDTDDRWVYVNRTWLAFTGQPLASETGEGWMRRLHPEEAATVRRSLWRHCAERRSFELEFRLRRHDGAYRWVLNTCIPRFGPDGEFAGYIGCCVDIDERKEAMAMLQRSQSELEQRVAERTTELVEINQKLKLEIEERQRVHERLVAYQNDLRSLAGQLTIAEERERRRIASDLHDHIGQNLALAKIRLGMLGEEAQAHGFGDKVKFIRDLIEETIGLTRTLTFELASPALHELGLEAALESLTRKMQERYGLAVRFRDDQVKKDIGENLRTILFQAVRELLHNVAKYARASEATVSSRRDGNEIVIAVEDDGAGFAAPVRAAGGRSAGEGFGLFNIRERLEHVGGNLEIRSEPGKGARVTLRAPLWLDDDAEH